MSAISLAARALAAISLGCILPACGLSGPAYGPASSNVAFRMGFDSYSPVEVTVRAGDTVEFRNTSLITHSVTNDPQRARKAGDVTVPAGAQPFDSGDIAAGQVFTHTFSAPGTYRFFCTHHDGMVATVVVTP
jgi:plastocyanin